MTNAPDDLVERRPVIGSHYCLQWGREAAAEITRLRERVAALEAENAFLHKRRGEVVIDRDRYRAALGKLPEGRDVFVAGMLAELAKWQELHRVIAEELGADKETWPDHRNAPLAIAATFMLHKQAAERADAERDALRVQIAEQAQEIAGLRALLRQAYPLAQATLNAALRWNDYNYALRWNDYNYDNATPNRWAKEAADKAGFQCTVDGDAAAVAWLDAVDAASKAARAESKS